MNYLIYSKKRTNEIAMWWLPNAAGYTNNVDEAGRYSRDDAESHCSGSHGDSISVDEMTVYCNLQARRIIDLGDGGNRMLLVAPNKELEANLEKLRAAPSARPVRCFFCGAQMYYKGHECHEPELRITITDSYDDDGETFYCHIRCWDERMLAGLAYNAKVQPVA